MRVARGLLLLAAMVYIAAFVGEHAGVLALARDRDGRDLDITHERVQRPSSASRTETLPFAHARRRPRGVRAAPRLGRTLFTARFGPGVHLVTNDFAYYNPDNVRAVRSPVWLVTSGSMFARNGVGWSGVPDSRVPNARSSNGTGSATFRAVTARRNFRNVAVSFDLKLERLVSTRRNPRHTWDGVHVFLHYRSQHSLYVVSIDRRDGESLVKRKRPGGPANGGTYYTIGRPVHHRAKLGRWERVLVTIRSTGRRSVTIDCYLNGRLLLSAQDTGATGQPLTEAGAVGLRGDNAEFEIAHFRVRALRA
jgi:hypothetical protein